MKQYGVPYEMLDRDGCVAAGARAAASGIHKIAGGAVAARIEDRRMPHVHGMRSRPLLRRRGVAVSF